MNRKSLNDMMRILQIFLIRLVLVAAIIASSSFTARAVDLDDNTIAPKPFNPAIVYISSSETNDLAFVSAALAGAERARQQFDIQYKEARVNKAQDLQSTLEKLARAGYSPIIALGYQNVEPVSAIASRFPSTHFNVIDGLVPPIYANVQSSIFKDHEGAFLVGMIAAYSSKSNHIAFIGGMDVPTIRNIAMGFRQGASYADHDIRIDEIIIGTTSKSWSDPEKAFRLAQERYGNGVDVIFAAAGGSGLGVLKAAKISNAYAIGVDTNQNGLYPRHVLTSMVKRIDIAVYDALKNGQLGIWQSGLSQLGIKEGALDYAVDQHNKTLLSSKTIEKVADAKERIINGLINVENYSTR